MEGSLIPVNNEDDADTHDGNVEDKITPKESMAEPALKIVNNEVLVLTDEDECIDAVKNLGNVAMDEEIMNNSNNEDVEPDGETGVFEMKIMKVPCIWYQMITLQIKRYHGPIYLMIISSLVDVVDNNYTSVT